MLEAEAKFKQKGLHFAKHAVAVTGAGSELDKYAEKNGWLARFPMHDWVGGRTSVMSAVGLLPMALEGFEIDNFLAGAAAMDAHTRQADVEGNAAMLLALMWYYAGNGKGEKTWSFCRIKTLALFSEYLQQSMKSLEKGPGREHCASGDCGLRQQGLDRSARLRATIARWRAKFFRDLHRSAKGPARHSPRIGGWYYERRLSPWVLARNTKRTL
jgi:hypothetical protein